MEQNKENKERYGIIYKIENTVNGKCYIGQTTEKRGFKGRYQNKGNRIERVYKRHKKEKEGNRYYIENLLNDIEKYGFESFVVHEEFDTAYSQEELDSLEKKYILEFNCVDNGYNNDDGGSNGKHSIETRQKISKNHRDCKGENNPNYGKPRSKESREKMSNSIKGEKHPMYGKHHSMEARKKMSESSKGKKHSDETKQKMSKIFSGENNPRARKVICLNDNKVFNTGKECAEYYKLNKNTIIRICKHRQEQTKDGLIFMYYDEYLQQQKQQDQAVI